MTSLVFGTVLPWLLVGVGVWLGYQLVRQNGRILVRLESIERRLSPRDKGKPQEPRGNYLARASSAIAAAML